MESILIDAPFRKKMRLQGFDYSKAGYYFVTICTLKRRETLGKYVGGDAHIAPSIQLTPKGLITKKYIENINKKYENAYVDKYVIMPNHIHMIVVLDNGAMWASPPTKITIPQIIRTLKILVTKEAGASMFQESYYDHIIRNTDDYHAKWDYIDTNVSRWTDDDYYVSSE